MCARLNMKYFVHTLLLFQKKPLKFTFSLTLLTCVIASFVLWSTVNYVQGDIAHASSSPEEDDSVKIRDLPFAHHIKDPCAFFNESSYNASSDIVLMIPRAEFIKQFYINMRHFSRIYKDDVHTILADHTIAFCAELHLGSLPDTPTLPELEEMEVEEALNKIYRSLLVHSAYSFIIHHHVNSPDLKCSNIQEQLNLADQIHSMALKQKSLACSVISKMANLGYQRDDVTPLLDVTISDLSMCSRINFRECQVMNSAQKLLEDLQKYAAEGLESFSNSTLISSSTDSAVPVPSPTTCTIPI